MQFPQMCFLQKFLNAVSWILLGITVHGSLLFIVTRCTAILKAMRSVLLKIFFLILPKLPQMKTITEYRQTRRNFIFGGMNCVREECMLFDGMIGKAWDQKGWDPLTRVDQNAYATNYF